MARRARPLPPDAARLPGRLRALIASSGASQAAVARSAAVPVPNLCDYLAGRKAITDATLARLLTALGRTWADLDEPA